MTNFMAHADAPADLLDAPLLRLAQLGRAWLEGRGTAVARVMVALALLGPGPGLAADLASPRAGPRPSPIAVEEQDERELPAARQALLELKRADPIVGRFLDHAAGYAVFATVRRGVGGVGGVDGTGVLFVGGRAVGTTHLEQASFGPERGHRSYTEIVFFETPQALESFQRAGRVLDEYTPWTIVGGIGSGVISYADGLRILALDWVGQMDAVGVGGQRLAFRPFTTSVATSAL